MHRALIFSLAILSCLGTVRAEEASGYRDMVSVLHVHSDLVDGSSPPAALAAAARAAGLDALFITDHFLESITYAPWPLGNFMGVTYSRPSVARLGIDHYLDRLRRAERGAPGLLVVPGLEVTPYARWSGSFLTGDLALHDWHRHALILGLEDGRRLARLPVAGNRRGGIYGAWSLPFLIPVAALAWAVRRISRPGFREMRLRLFTVRRRRFPGAAILVGLAALACLVIGYPYRVERFSPVGADPGEAPLRDLVDWAGRMGGIVVWAHPEAAARDTVRGVTVDTLPYPEIVRSTGATVFSALPEGTETLIPAGGIWDRSLADYLAGRRPAPLFAVAESDEHRGARDIDFNLLQTVFLVHSRSHEALIEALRAGRCYARWTPRGRTPLRLAGWSVEVAGSPAQTAIAGETLATGGEVLVNALIEGEEVAVVARLIRDGTVIRTLRGVPPLDVAVSDRVDHPASYRLDVEGPYPWRLLSNPIFVVPSGPAPG